MDVDEKAGARPRRILRHVSVGVRDVKRPYTCNTSVHVRHGRAYVCACGGEGEG